MSRQQTLLDATALATRLDLPTRVALGTQPVWGVLLCPKCGGRRIAPRDVAQGFHPGCRSVLIRVQVGMTWKNARRMAEFLVGVRLPGPRLVRLRNFLDGK